MKDALTDEFYLSRMDWLKIIGVTLVLMIGMTYIIFELLTPI